MARAPTPKRGDVMLNSELEQVLSNWIKQALSPPGQLAEGQDPANWVAQRFIEWWRSHRVEPALNDAASALRAVRSDLERLGGWNNPQVAEAMHELIHIGDALGDLRAALGFDADI
jgi:hypothetical protein